MKRALFIFFVFLSVGCFAQFSKTHYIPPLSNSNSQEPQGQFMYISSPSLKKINFKIIQIGGITINGTVSRDAPYVYNIGSGFNTQLMVNAADVSSVLKNKGYIVEAEDLVYVTIRLTSTPFNYQAGGLVSKGLAALGTQFRIGAFTNTSTQTTNENHYTFASILATENNTRISFNNIKSGVSLLNNSAAGNTPADITLNSGESFVIAVQGPNDANRDALIGASITSDKAIAVNCGSFAGTNGDLQNLDLGFDQIVSAERTGKEYIFIKGGGSNSTERPLIVANENNTEVFLNGDITPFTILNAGDYVALDGSQFSLLGNLYVRTSKNVFAYQSIGGTISQANQNMHFVPPLSCETPKIIDNIPFINEVGSNTAFVGTVCIVTEKNAILNFIINGIPYTLTSLPVGIVTNGPLSVTGNSNYETYTFQGLTGNISVLSTKSVYLSYYGSSGAATYGGFYSGFTFKPQITFEKINSNQSSCIPNTKLSVSDLLGFDTFQWFLNKTPITGATTNNYSPTQPGYYYVAAAISNCGTTLISDEIPVSDCPTNMGSDLVNDNIDLDNDKDGIINCSESYGDIGIPLLNPISGTIVLQEYTNSLNGKITTIGTSVEPYTPFIGKKDGDFITEVPIGKGNSIEYALNFAKPISIELKYVLTANTLDLINSDADFIVKSDNNKTITVRNPDNQLLIDTNYDGIYESGIVEYSSFEIHFRANSTIPLAAGTGTFSFKSYLISNFTFIQKNNSDFKNNKATFSIIATCIPKDSDGDGISDQLDLDSDNDGIPDNIEAQNPLKLTTNIDVDSNGVDDAYEPGLSPIDTDKDGIPNYLDLDSDNNGIYDLVESGSPAIDINSDGIIDGITSSFGTNGLSNSLETSADSGILNYSISDTDMDGINNTIESDNDDDLCSDVLEAGFADGNKDSFLGDSSTIVNKNGIVINATDGYSIPNDSYITAAPIIIDKQPTSQIACEFQNAIFTIETNLLDTYQWQVSIDGNNWNAIIDDETYSGSTTNTLLLMHIKSAMNDYKYRVKLTKKGNSCGLTSNEVSLSILSLPIITPSIILVQCDNDIDGYTNFNLTEKNNFISTNSPNEVFTYYTSLEGATTKAITSQISNPTQYYATNSIIWARVENSNGCFSIAQLNLMVSSTQIPTSFTRSFSVCDDYLDIKNDDKDGVATFDFSSVSEDILSILPFPNSNYRIAYYQNETDALAENNEITTINSYRNNSSPKQQKIWIRVESTLDNACYGLGAYITLQVDPKPNINTNEDQSETKLVCSNLPTFFVELDAGITDGSSVNNYTYTWSKDGNIIADAKDSILNVNAIGTYSVEVVTPKGCSRTRTIKVITSDIAHIDSIDIVDLSDTNSVTVNVSGQGKYEYSIDAPNGPFQAVNFFNNVTAGIHEIYIFDKNNCGTISKAIAVVGIPKFFTPNGDGYNDYWNIKGINQSFNTNSTIYIFDKYGKLIKQILASDKGWDGMLNGNQMPADDYWFTVKLQDGRESKGHFSLKR